MINGVTQNEKISCNANTVTPTRVGPLSNSIGRTTNIFILYNYRYYYLST